MSRLHPRALVRLGAAVLLATAAQQAEAQDGSRIRPSVELAGGSGLGFAPQVGVTWTKYGLSNAPYATQLELTAAYSTSVAGFRVTLTGDQRFESTPLHLVGMARMSDFEVINFTGFGNNTVGDPENWFEVRQRQWMFHPALAYDLGRPESAITLGPVVQYSTMDNVADRFITQERPYGYGDFRQAGARLGVRYDARDNDAYPTRGFLVDATASTYPTMWDVEENFSTVGGFATTFVELPLPKNPVLAFRGGARRVFGDAPFFESAFLGGRGTVRGMDAQRFAGDALLYGTSEIRVPLGTATLILPIDIGLLGFYDTGRVWYNGDSPGGWHDVAGAGVWFGIVDPGTGVSVTFTNSSEKRVLLGTGLRF